MVPTLHPPTPPPPPRLQSALLNNTQLSGQDGKVSPGVGNPPSYKPRLARKFCISPQEVRTVASGIINHFEVIILKGGGGKEKNRKIQFELSHAQ